MSTKPGQLQCVPFFCFGDGSGKTPVYEFHTNLSNGGLDYRYSTSSSPSDWNVGWAQYGVAFYAGSSSDSGCVAIYEYSNTDGLGTHYAYFPAGAGGTPDPLTGCVMLPGWTQGDVHFG